MKMACSGPGITARRAEAARVARGRGQTNTPNALPRCTCENNLSNCDDTGMIQHNNGSATSPLTTATVGMVYLFRSASLSPCLSIPLSPARCLLFLAGNSSLNHVQLSSPQKLSA